MQGMNQIFEWDRPKKIPAQQLLCQWTVELPLALKLPRCAKTCVQWIVLISGPDRVRVIIKLMFFYVICNGVLSSCISIISARAVTCKSSDTTVTAGPGVRLSQTASDSESESAPRTLEQTCVTVSDPVLGTMRQACNYQVANLG